MYSLSMIDPSMRDYKQYREDTIDDIHACVESLNCQPILFLGSGIIKRYANGPNWEELLNEMASRCPAIDKPYAYFKQKYQSLPEIGSVFSEKYNDWAWGDGKYEFPEELFNENVKPDLYFKVKVAAYFESLRLGNSEKFNMEIKALQKIHPHSIITTNYDNLLSGIFPEYEVIIGEKVIKQSHSSIGELYKIHGCITEPETLVINKNDYENFVKKKKYLSAKLLTYFIEHPLIFIGYSANDENIRGILSDLDEILSESGELIPNIYFIEYNENMSDSEYPPREMMIPTDNNKNIRVKCIRSDDFCWIFDAFCPTYPLDKVSPKTLRAIFARTYKMVRSDIPRNPMIINYQTFDELANNEDALLTLLGFTALNNSACFNLEYPYSPTKLGQELGFKGWHEVNKLLEQIREASGIDIRSTDNQYHSAIMNFDKLQGRRYSKAALELLKKVRDGKTFHIEI